MPMTMVPVVTCPLRLLVSVADRAVTRQWPPPVCARTVTGLPEMLSSQPRLSCMAGPGTVVGWESTPAGGLAGTQTGCGGPLVASQERATPDEYVGHGPEPSRHFATACWAGPSRAVSSLSAWP